MIIRKLSSENRATGSFLPCLVAISLVLVVAVTASQQQVNDDIYQSHQLSREELRELAENLRDAFRGKGMYSDGTSEAGSELISPGFGVDNTIVYEDYDATGSGSSYYSIDDLKIDSLEVTTSDEPLYSGSEPAKPEAVGGKETEDPKTEEGGVTPSEPVEVVANDDFYTFSEEDYSRGVTLEMPVLSNDSGQNLKWLSEDMAAMLGIEDLWIYPEVGTLQKVEDAEGYADKLTYSIVDEGEASKIEPGTIVYIQYWIIDLETINSGVEDPSVYWDAGLVSICMGGECDPQPSQESYANVEFVVSNDDPNNVADNMGFEYSIEVTPYAQSEVLSDGQGYKVIDGTEDKKIWKGESVNVKVSFEIPINELIADGKNEVAVTVTISPLPVYTVGEYDWSNNQLSYKLKLSDGSGENHAPVAYALMGRTHVVLGLTPDQNLPSWLIDSPELSGYYTSGEEETGSDSEGVRCYYGALAFDPDGHNVSMKFNFNYHPLSGGGFAASTSAWENWILPPKSGGYSSMIESLFIQEKTWTTPGTYNVSAMAKDDPNGDGDISDGLESLWSGFLTVTVQDKDDFIDDWIGKIGDPVYPPIPSDTSIMIYTNCVNPAYQIIFQNVGPVQSGMQGYGSGSGGIGDFIPGEQPGTGASGTGGLGGSTQGSNQVGAGETSWGGTSQMDIDLNQGPNNNPICLTAGTKILMADGDTKNIEDIEVGDEVLSYNVEKQKLEKTKVEGLASYISKSVYNINDGLLEITDNHPIFVFKESKQLGWSAINPKEAFSAYNKKSMQLKIGDILFSSEGKAVEIKSIEKTSGEVKVYTFGVNSEAHSYFANGLLVHNSNNYNLGTQEEDTVMSGAENRQGNEFWDLQKILAFANQDYNEVADMLDLPGNIRFSVSVKMQINGNWVTILDWPGTDMVSENTVSLESNGVIYNDLGDSYSLHSAQLVIRATAV